MVTGKGLRTSRIWQDSLAAHILFEGDDALCNLWVGFAKQKLQFMLHSLPGPSSSRFFPAPSIEIKIDTRPNRIYIKTGSSSPVHVCLPNFTYGPGLYVYTDIFVPQAQHGTPFTIPKTVLYINSDPYRNNGLHPSYGAWKNLKKDKCISWVDGRLYQIGGGALRLPPSGISIQNAALTSDGSILMSNGFSLYKLSAPGVLEFEVDTGIRTQLGVSMGFNASADTWYWRGAENPVTGEGMVGVKEFTLSSDYGSFTVENKLLFSADNTSTDDSVAPHLVDNITYSILEEYFGVQGDGSQDYTVSVAGDRHVEYTSEGHLANPYAWIFRSAIEGDTVTVCRLVVSSQTDKTVVKATTYVPVPGAPAVIRVYTSGEVRLYILSLEPVPDSEITTTDNNRVANFEVLVRDDAGVYNLAMVIPDSRSLTSSNSSSEATYSGVYSFVYYVNSVSTDVGIKTMAIYWQCVNSYPTTPCSLILNYAGATYTLFSSPNGQAMIPELLYTLAEGRKTIDTCQAQFDGKILVFCITLPRDYALGPTGVEHDKTYVFNFAKDGSVTYLDWGYRFDFRNRINTQDGPLLTYYPLSLTTDKAKK